MEVTWYLLFNVYSLDSNKSKIRLGYVRISLQLYFFMLVLLRMTAVTKLATDSVSACFSLDNEDSLVFENTHCMLIFFQISFFFMLAPFGALFSYYQLFLNSTYIYIIQ